MPRLIALLVALLVSAATCPAFAKDTIYRDSRRPSFTILVPDGWTVSTTGQGISLKHGESAEVDLFVQAQALDPGEYKDKILPQMRKQTQNFRLLDEGGCLFGKQNGVYAVYSGISPNGGNHTTKMVTMTNGQLTYLLFEQSTVDKYDREKPVMQRIQDSFTPDDVETAAAKSPEKLDALHAAGVMTDEEYETAKKNETTFRDSRQPPYSLAVPAGWTALKNDGGVKLEKRPSGSGVVQVWIQPGTGEPLAVIAGVGPQFEKQLTQFRVLEEGEIRVGGLKGAYGAYTGIGNSGKPKIIKLLTTTDGKWIIDMVMMSDLESYNTYKNEYDRIQQSFVIENAASQTERGRK